MIAPWMTADKLAHEIHSDVMASEVEIADAIDALVQREVRKAVLEEREACAVIAESKVKFNRQSRLSAPSHLIIQNSYQICIDDSACEIAKEIRERGQ